MCVQHVIHQKCYVESFTNPSFSLDVLLKRLCCYMHNALLKRLCCYMHNVCDNKSSVSDKLTDSRQWQSEKQFSSVNAPGDYLDSSKGKKTHERKREKKKECVCVCVR